jgi:hypothetical protein
MGNSILAKTIKASTVDNYLKEAAHLHTSQGDPNPTRDANNRRFYLISEILHEQRRWESQPERREPLTWEMIEYLQTLPTPASSRLAALTDWFIVGMYAGFRLSEWAQPDNLPSAYPYQLGRRGDSLAITAGDIRFSSQGLSITWRYQKNGRNDEKILFAATPSKPARCPFLAMQRIVRRASQLGNQQSEPLAVYADTNGRAQYVTDKDISFYLQRAAAIAHNITDPKQLSLWTSHSVRVGACVALHEAGAEPLTIQNRLRWCSLSFMNYLRHTFKLAESHAALVAHR